jgi:iron complex outermembrane receptor protein
MGWKQFTRNRLSASIVAIDDIKRVEIVKGPGSALWGANATLGVINVITKSGEDIRGSEIVIGGGSYHTWFEHVAVGKVLKNDINLFVSANRYKNNTSSARRLKEYSEILGYDVYADNQREEDYTFYTKLAYRNFAFSGYASRFDVYWPLSTWAL